MGLRREPYGDLWACCGCGVGLMGIYGGAVAAVWDLWGYGADLWVARAAVPTLWGSMGLLWLRCGAMGFCCESILLLWLRSRAYGVNLWGYKFRTNRSEDK